MKIIGYFFLCCLILLAVTFACLNAEVVNINYYIGTKGIALSILLIWTLAIGAVIGFVFGLWPLLHLKASNFRLRQKLRLAEKEINNLRTLPLQDNR